MENKVKNDLTLLAVAISICITIVIITISYGINNISRSIDKHNELYERHLTMLNKQDSLIKVINYNNAKYQKLNEDNSRLLLMYDDYTDQHLGIGKYAKK